MSLPWLVMPCRRLPSVVGKQRQRFQAALPLAERKSMAVKSCWQCRSGDVGRRTLCSSSSRRNSGGQTLLRNKTADVVSPALLSSGVVPLASRRLISVAGPDAAKYLQGVITSNIQQLQGALAAEAEVVDGSGSSSSSSGFYSAFLNAQGRVLHDVFVYRDTLGVGGADGEAAADGGFLIEVDADEAATLEKHIRRYKLRARFAVRLLDAGELTVWQAWGVEAGPAEGVSDAAIRLCDTRAPGMGWRFVTRAGAMPALTNVSASSPSSSSASSPSALAPERAYRLHRYLLGVAEGQREILRGQALPLESNMDLMGAIDFHKGCYVGQELTIRTRHRGVVRKRILPVAVYEDDGGEKEEAVTWPLPLSLCLQGPADAVAPETSIGRVGKKGRSAGKWLSGTGSLGLALCRLETMTDVVLPDEAAASAAAVAATPTLPGSESQFVLAAAAADQPDAASPRLRVKAFVPDWLRQGLAAASTQ